MSRRARGEHGGAGRSCKRWLLALALLILIMIVTPFIARLY